MFIKNITISNVSFHPNIAAHSGSVVLELAQADGEAVTHSHFLCRVSGSEDTAPSELCPALARAALKQAKRLPDMFDLSENTAFLPENITKMP